MERHLLVASYHLLNILRPPHGPSGTVYSDATILLVAFWATVCDRPACWAASRENWPRELEHVDLPSPSTLSRRLKSSSVRALIEQVREYLEARDPPGTQAWIDGKPLIVGGATQDPEAKAGRAVGHLARGYKLHAIVTNTHRLLAWEIAPLNIGEQTVARQLIPQVPAGAVPLLVGDHNYDVNALYDLAAERGMQMVATPDKDMRARGLGRRKHSPYRISGFAIAMSPAGTKLLRDRFGIDRMFGQLGNFGGGLSPLPNWVRRLRRVRRWVAVKLLAAALRRHQKQRLTS